MSGISGYPSQEKLVTALVGYDSLESKTSSQFVTISENHTKKVLADVKIHGYFRTSALAKSIASVDTSYPKQVIHSTSHGAKRGDFVRFETGNNQYFEAMVINVPDANKFIIGSTLPNDAVIGDTFFVLRSIVPVYDSSGALTVSPGPIQFVKNGTNVQVIEDTVTPANNVPLPVKLTGITGDVTITAQNLNVQTSHTGLNPDSMQIGDGTNVLGVSAAGEAKVIAAQLPSTLGQKASAASTSVVLSTEQEGLIGALTEVAPATDTDSSGLNGRLQRIAQRLTSLIGLLPASLGQKASAGSLSTVLSTEQEALIGALTEAAPATDTASSGLNGRLQRIAQRLTSLIGLLPASLGQKTMANSLAVAIASDQSNVNVNLNGNALSTNNATTTPLAGGATFTGLADDMLQYAAAIVNVTTDQNGTLNVEYSHNGVNWYHIQSNPIVVTTPGVAEGFSFQLMVEGQFFRLRYVNGASAQGTFVIETILQKASGTAEVSAVHQTIIAKTDALVTKGVIYGLSSSGGGTYVAVKVNPSGALAVDATSNGANIATETTQVANGVLIGAVTETAPATDTASSGLNGRLQRIAQRITSLIALLPASLGTKAAASSLATTWSTEDEALVGALTETAPATDTASSGLNGRLQRIAQRITSLIALLPTSLGQKTMANSFAVTLASDQSALPSLSGRNKVAQLYNDYSSVNVTTINYTQLTASTASAVNKIQVFDSSGQTMILAVGAAASEVDQCYIFPGGQGDIDLYIPASSRIAIKAKTASATSGYIAINLFS